RGEKGARSPTPGAPATITTAPRAKAAATASFLMYFPLCPHPVTTARREAVRTVRRRPQRRHFAGLVEDALPVLDLRKDARRRQSATGDLDVQVQLGGRRRAAAQ